GRAVAGPRTPGPARRCGRAPEEASHPQVAPERQERRYGAEQDAEDQREPDDVGDGAAAQRDVEVEPALDPVQQEELGPDDEAGGDDAADQAGDGALQQEGELD